MVPKGCIGGHLNQLVYWGDFTSAFQTRPCWLPVPPGHTPPGCQRAGADQLQIRASPPRGRQHVVNAGNKKFFIIAVVQVLCTGGSIELLIFEVIRPADGIMADDLLFHRVAHPAVGPILQVAVGREVAGKGQQCAVRAVGKIARLAKLIERLAEEQVVAVIKEQRLIVRQAFRPAQGGDGGAPSLRAGPRFGIGVIGFGFPGQWHGRGYAPPAPQR